MRRLSSPRVLLAVAVVAALPVAGLIASARAASGMATAADAFLASLTPEQKQQAVLPLEGEEPSRWHYIPNEMFPRKGLQLKDMTEAQRTLAHDLMKTGLSQRGFMTATSIMALEDVLHAIEAAAGDPGAGGRRFARNPLEYDFTVFGTPAAKGTWGWRVNGHHLSLNFTIANGTGVATSPTFFGSQSGRGARRAEEGYADPRADGGCRLRVDRRVRRRAARHRDHPEGCAERNRDAEQAGDRSAVTRRAVGLSMTPPQRDLLMKVIDAYVSQMTEDVAAERMARITKAGAEKIAFAWAGRQSEARNTTTACRARRS